MTRSDGNKVSLTGGNWAGILSTTGAALLGQWLLIQQRVASLEYKADAVEVRVGQLETALSSGLSEVRTDIKEILKQTKK